jgi:uncharacterized protein (DUF2141 family)
VRRHVDTGLRDKTVRHVGSRSPVACSGAEKTATFAASWFALDGGQVRSTCGLPRSAEATLGNFWKLSVGVLALLLPAASAAAEVTVRVENLRRADGSVLVAICSRESFLDTNCSHRGRAQARAGAAEVSFEGVPPGLYAVQAIHDENDNGELDRDLFGRPVEGMAFSRDAPMRRGPPRFADAAVAIGTNGEAITISMRYF